MTNKHNEIERHLGLIEDYLYKAGRHADDISCGVVYSNMTEELCGINKQIESIREIIKEVKK